MKRSPIKQLSRGRSTVLALGLLVGGTPVALADTAPAAESSRAPVEVSRRAADAHVEAVAKAASALSSATKLDLDIRLVGDASVQVASDLL